MAIRLLSPAEHPDKVNFSLLRATLFAVKRRVHMRKKPAEKLKDKCVIHKVKNEGRSHMVWECFQE